tara:strand:+ start:49 stop:285 length:237 start_codon:yes stop_codon:yes gene_type:complete
MLPYMIHATNNLNNILTDPKGAVCIYCLKKPIITNHTKTTDESTVICPLCNIDAVVPCSVIPNKRTLKKWRKLGFGDN